MSIRISYFISSHGFGHATRAAAVMAAIKKTHPTAHFDIFTQTPRWLFTDSMLPPFSFHPLQTDVGLVQSNSLHENISATLQALEKFIPFDSQLVTQLAEQLRSQRSACQLVMCDIAPLGIAAARAAGIPSVLVENFTWDWIYAGYNSSHATRFAPFITYLETQFSNADYHVQTAPLCQPSPSAHLTTAPVSRTPKTPARQVRRKLGLSESDKMVVVTMGGTAVNYDFLNNVADEPGRFFVVAGANFESRRGIIALPQHSPIFHPDLINAADAVIGKVGYSTLAEVYQAGIPFGYIARPRFRESAPLFDFIEANMPCRPITEAQLQDGTWQAELGQLLSLPKQPPPGKNGAAQIAEFVTKLLT